MLHMSLLGGFVFIIAKAVVCADWDWAFNRITHDDDVRDYNKSLRRENGLTVLFAVVSLLIAVGLVGVWVTGGFGPLTK